MALLFFIIHIAHGVRQDAPEKPNHEGHVEENGLFEEAIAAVSHQSREKFAKYPEAIFPHENEKIFANIERNKQ